MDEFWRNTWLINKLKKREWTHTQLPSLRKEFRAQAKDDGTQKLIMQQSDISPLSHFHFAVQVFGDCHCRDIN